MNSREHIILFDGVCNMCNAIVQFIIRHDKKEIFKFASLQSPAGQQLLRQAGLPLQDFDSFVYSRMGQIYSESTAALLLLKDLGGIFKWIYPLIWIPGFIRNAVYKMIAKSRYSIWGKRTACMIPTDAVKKRFLEDELIETYTPD